jgi:Cu-Zn family superoxide dismutase
MSRTFTWAVMGLLGAGLAGAAAVAAEPGKSEKIQEDAKMHTKSATAVVAGAGDMKDKIKGELTFVDTAGGVKVTGKITGLTPGKHGFHIHEKADLSDPKLTGAGGHFNPGKEKHGGPESHARHAGDLGNILADDKGVAPVDGTFKGISIDGKENGIVGRSVIVHAKEDDEKTDPSGASGDRIAGGAIVVTKKDAK